MAGALGVLGAIGMLLAALPGTARAQEPPPAGPPALTTPAAATSAPAATTARAHPDRITFELKVPAERGGGTISGSAAELESFGEAQVTASGAVEIHFRDVVVHAERLSLDRDTMTVQAEGDVVFDQGPQRISGQRVDFDLEQRTGTFWQATAFVHPDYYFRGMSSRRPGPTTSPSTTASSPPAPATGRRTGASRCPRRRSRSKATRTSRMPASG